MPVVSVSLSEIGYEGYTSLTKGKRSKVIDKLLREYALKRSYTVFEGEHISVQEVFERQKHLEERIEYQFEQIVALKKELKE